MTNDECHEWGITMKIPIISAGPLGGILATRLRQIQLEVMGGWQLASFRVQYGMEIA